MRSAWRFLHFSLFVVCCYYWNSFPQCFFFWSFQNLQKSPPWNLLVFPIARPFISLCPFVRLAYYPVFSSPFIFLYFSWLHTTCWKRKIRTLSIFGSSPTICQLSLNLKTRLKFSIEKKCDHQILFFSTFFWIDSVINPKQLFFPKTFPIFGSVSIGPHGALLAKPNFDS